MDMWCIDNDRQLSSALRRKGAEVVGGLKRQSRLR